MAGRVRRHLVSTWSYLPSCSRGDTYCDIQTCGQMCGLLGSYSAPVELAPEQYG